MMSTLEKSEIFLQLRAHWQSLPLARQRILLAALLLLAFGLLWALVYQPLQMSRVSNTARISTLQASLAQMQRDVAEYKQLNTLAPAAEKNIKQNIDSAKLEALFGATSKVAALADGQLQITSNNIQYADWLAKTDEVLSRYRVTINDLSLKRVEGGLVNATLTLKVRR
jgi:type II secretory pathway component PulM